jgi:3-dehydroquinate synthase
VKQVTVALPGRAYDILIQRGLLDHAGERCARVLPAGCRVALVTDSNVGPRFAGRIMDSLTRAGFQTEVFTVPAGEPSKNAATLADLWERFMAFGLTRGDAVAALGGGMVGDLAGFAAATVLRGVALIQIPTTLLSQVDSSVGGKVAIDLRAGKNLAGAFWQPRLVLIDPDVLDTLPDEIFSDGMAEVIKYGCIGNRSFLDLLHQCNGRTGITNQIEEVIRICCAQKSDVVCQDERDTGLRMILNFGHTLGHAYEKAYHYQTYSHGQAVAAGMCRAGEIGVRLGLTPPDAPEVIEELVRMYNLPTRIYCPIEAYRSAVGLDKKGVGSSISVILLRKLGQAEPVLMDKEALLNQIVKVESESL